MSVEKEQQSPVLPFLWNLWTFSVMWSYTWSVDWLCPCLHVCVYLGLLSCASLNKCPDLWALGLRKRRKVAIRMLWSSSPDLTLSHLSSRCKTSVQGSTSVPKFGSCKLIFAPCVSFENTFCVCRVCNSFSILKIKVWNEKGWCGVSRNRRGLGGDKMIWTICKRR